MSEGYPLDKPISKSNYFNFYTCPRMFEFSAIKDIPIEANKFMLEGSEVHRILEQFFSTKITQEADIHQRLEPFVAKYPYLNAFITMEKQRFQEDEHYFPVERERDMYENTLKIHAILDRIDEVDGGHRVVEYKSKYNDGIWQELNFQALCAMDSGFEPVELAVFGYKTGEWATNKPSKIIQANIKKKVAKMWEAIKKNEFPCKVGHQCRWCNFRPICDFGVSEGELKFFE